MAKAQLGFVMARLAHLAAFSLLFGVLFAAPGLAQTTPATPATPATPPAQAEPAPAPAPAGDVLTNVTLNDVQTALMNAGYRAQIKEDNRGSFIASATAGQSFFVSLASCDNGSACRTLVMETGGWTPTTPPTVESLNKFHYDNGGWITVATYSDGLYYGNARASLHGGVTMAWLQDELTAFANMTETFIAYMRQ